MTVSVDHTRSLSGAEAFERVFAFDNRRYVEEKGFTVTANLFCRRAVFDAVGPFAVGVSKTWNGANGRPRWDTDWGMQRTRRRTSGAARLACVARQWRRLNAESFALTVTRPLGRARWGVRSLGLLPSIVAHVPRVLGSGALVHGVERRRALVTLARLRWWRFVDAQRLLFRGR